MPEFQAANFLAMSYVRRNSLASAFGFVLLTTSVSVWAQNKPISLHPPGAETAPAPQPAPDAAPPPAPAPAPAPAASAPGASPYTPAPSSSTANVGRSSSANVGYSTPVPAHGRLTVSSRGGKVVVAKPLAQKPPEPILDAEGLQRYDPDGRPMFSPAVYQLRDRKGQPVVDADGKPVFQTPDNLGYDERGHLIKPPRQPKIVPTPKKPVVIEHGSLEINGIVGKVQLNYTIDSLRFLYLYSPEIGVTLVSDQPFPGAKLQANAFHGKTLTVKVDGKLLTVSSDQPLLGGKPRPAFVAVDRTFTLPSNFPVFGFGSTDAAPYAWPGSQRDTAFVSADAPKVIEGLKPKLDDGAAAAVPTPNNAPGKSTRQ